MVELTIGPRSGKVVVGQVTRFDIVAVDEGGGVHSDFDPGWVSTDGTVARVDPFGFATGKRKGETFVLARYGGLRDSVPLAVIDSIDLVRTISITPAIGSLLVGATRNYQATVRDSLGRTMSWVQVVWSVSDPARAGITAQGVLTALTPGSVFVEAEAGAVRASVLLAILAPPP